MNNYKRGDVVVTKAGNIGVIAHAPTYVDEHSVLEYLIRFADGTEDRQPEDQLELQYSSHQCEQIISAYITGLYMTHCDEAVEDALFNVRIDCSAYNSARDGIKIERKYSPNYIESNKTVSSSSLMLSREIALRRHQEDKLLQPLALPAS